MRAWQVTAATASRPSALTLDDVPDADARPGRGAASRVRAVAVNFPDVLLAPRASTRCGPTLPFVPGHRAVRRGRRRSATASRGVAVGDRVVGVADRGARRVRACSTARCLPRARRARRRRGRRPDHRVPDGVVRPAPAGRAAAGRDGCSCTPRPAASARAAVQLGAAAGARVIGVVGSAGEGGGRPEAGRETSSSTRSTRTSSAVVKAATGGRGADVVFDPVGGDAFDASTQVHRVRGADRRGRLRGRRRSRPCTAGHALVKNYGVLGLHWALYPQRRPELVDDGARRADAAGRRRARSGPWSVDVVAVRGRARRRVAAARRRRPPSGRLVGAGRVDDATARRARRARHGRRARARRGVRARPARRRRARRRSPTCSTTTARRSPPSSATARSFVHLDVTDEESWAAAVAGHPSRPSARSTCWSTTRASRTPAPIEHYTLGEVGRRHRGQPHRASSSAAGGRADDEGGRARLDHQHLVGRGHARRPRPARLHRRRSSACAA